MVEGSDMYIATSDFQHSVSCGLTPSDDDHRVHCCAAIEFCAAAAFDGCDEELLDTRGERRRQLWEKSRATSGCACAGGPDGDYTQAKAGLRLARLAARKGRRGQGGYRAGPVRFGFLWGWAAEV